MDAETFRIRAHECRQLASMVSQPENRAFWLRLAIDWLNVAALTEKHRRASRRQTEYYASQMDSAADFDRK
jgi:hypothetical protein